MSSRTPPRGILAASAEGAPALRRSDGGEGRAATAVPASLDGCDLLIALLLASASAGLYAATALGRIYANDGAMLASWVADPERGFPDYHNVLYQPCGRLLDALLPRWLRPAGDPLALPKALSIVPAAIGVALCYPCGRLLGASRAAALAAAALLAVTPAVWFFGAAIEVHALHLAVCAAAALGTLLLPWGRQPVLAALGSAALFVLPYLSHQSAPVLGPGFVLLAQCARRRTAPPFGLPALAAVGAALLGSLVVGQMLGRYCRGLGFALDIGWVATTVAGWRREFTPAIVWEGLVQPLLWLLVAAAPAFAWRRVDGWLRLGVAVLVVPAAGSVLWWGNPERGGYLIAQAFFLAILAGVAATGLTRRALVAAAALLVGAQGWAGWHFVRDFDREGFQLVDRVARVRAHLGDQGFLLAANDNAPDIRFHLPDVTELNVFAALVADVDPETWVAALEPVIGQAAGGRSFVFDVSYQRRDDLPGPAAAKLAALERALRAAWVVDERDDPSWPLWVLAPR